MRGVYILACFIVLLQVCSGDELRLLNDYPDALCLDGSPGGYTYRINNGVFGVDIG